MKSIQLSKSEVKSTFMILQHYRCALLPVSVLTVLIPELQGGNLDLQITGRDEGAHVVMMTCFQLDSSNAMSD